MSLYELDLPISICMFVTGLMVLIGFGLGVRALVLTKSNPEASSLKLIALNLLEPSVTIMVLFVGYTIGDAITASDDGFFVLPLLAAIPCTGMLLAPLWTKITHPICGTLSVYGLMRWLNTISFWILGTLAVLYSSNNDLFALAAALIVSGTLILCVSVVHLASSLGDLGKLKATHS